MDLAAPFAGAVRRADFAWAWPAGLYARRLGITHKTFEARFRDGLFPCAEKREQEGKRARYRLRLDKLDPATREKVFDSGGNGKVWE